MASWEAAALKLQSQVAVTSDPNSLDKDKCLPPLPLQQKSTVTTTIEAEEPTKGWKPLSLSTPILSAVIALTLLLAAAVETIAQRSAAQGGLALSPTLDDLPGYAKFSYLYVPTIIAVFYSMIWSWIDLDVKRMQPWFELSKPEGATAENSIFLDYQYDFVALVPFKAAKKRHWPVFFGGTAMVLVFWLLTPLQSALLGTEVITKTESATIGTRSQLRPLGDQVPLLDPEVLNTGYAVGWLDQPFPPFSRPKYALLPFYLKDDPTPDKVESNWTAETTMLSTELNCWPAEIEQDGPKSKASFNFLNGQGCNATIPLNRLANYSMLYIGYRSSPYSDFWLGSTRCVPTTNSTHQFLAIWAKPEAVRSVEETPDFNLTAVFCQPKYYKQRVMATVKSTTLEVIDGSVQQLSPPEALPEQEFNSTAFEYLLANGMAERPIVKDFPFNNVVEQQPQLNSTGLTRPVSNMVGFALAGRSLPVTDYSSPELLSKVYGDAHQYLFSVAVTKLLTNETRMSNSSASVDFALSGVVVSRVFATLVDCLLVVIAVFAAMVLRFCRIAPNNLPMNPSSIGRQIDLLRHSPEVLRAMRRMDSADEKSLEEEFRQDELRLFYDGNSKSVKILIERCIPDDSSHTDPSVQKGYYEPIRPLPLKKESGVLFVLALIGAIIGLSYLKQQETNLNGLYRPTDNFEVLQLLENYIPTIFATLVEPFWVLLNRLLCVLQPFRDLWKGKAESSRTIEATYTSIPPQLVLWRALKSGHFILALLCTMALISNILAVGLGSLFNEAPMIAKYSETLQPAFAPRFDNSSVFNLGTFFSSNLITTTQYQDHFYIALANISSDTPLPPWVSKDYYFQRHTISDSTSRSPEDTYQLQARGYGASANCTAIPSSKVPIYKSAFQFWQPGEPMDQDLCVTKNLIDSASYKIRESTLNRTSGVSATEYCNTLSRSTAPEPCDKKLTLGWGRTAHAENVNGTVEASFLLCYPVFETAMFNITVDVSGRVLNYKRASDLEGTLSYNDSQVHTDVLFQHFNHQWNKGDAQWHNDTLSKDWMNYLIVLLSGSRDAVDPEAPVPDPEKLSPKVEEIYRRLYAIFLSRNEHVFDRASTKEQTTAIRQTKETRIFMEDASFIISMTILAVNILVAILFYYRTVAFVLPRMPTTLGSIIAYTAASRLATAGFKNAPGQTDRTFSFGRYIGLDGESHIGIDMDPHVVPVHPSSLQDDNKGFFNRMRRKIRPQEDKLGRSGTWL